MPNQFFTASQIHDGQKFLPKGSTIELDDDKRIVAIHEQSPAKDVAFFGGILCPGFVNAHCHLELSHMRGVIPEGTGLIPFLQSVMRERGNFSDEQKKTARHEAYDELIGGGVVAVGDIANSGDTLDLRTRGGLHMHTFVECLGFTEIHAAARLAYSEDVFRQFCGQPSGKNILRQSITPHAPYSVSPALFRLIDAVDADSILSIHNGESEAEYEYFRYKAGPVKELLGGLGVDDAFFLPSGEGPLQDYLPLLSESHQLLLVHNTFTGAEDVAFAQRRKVEPFWCLCPGANLYIEGALPDVSMLARAMDNICIGTDSLASNRQLSILEELKILQKTFALDWEVLLRWATYNGALALGMDSEVGSLRPGRRPGLNWLSFPGGEPVVTRAI